MGRVSELGDLDVRSEDGYREFSQKAVALMHDLMVDLDFVAGVVSAVLVETRTNDPKINARKEARKVRGYLRRATQAAGFGGKQVAAAFKATEVAFLGRPAKQAGMRKSSRASRAGNAA